MEFLTRAFQKASRRRFSAELLTGFGAFADEPAAAQPAEDDDAPGCPKDEALAQAFEVQQ